MNRIYVFKHFHKHERYFFIKNIYLNQYVLIVVESLIRVTRNGKYIPTNYRPTTELISYFYIVQETRMNIPLQIHFVTSECYRTCHILRIHTHTNREAVVRPVIWKSLLANRSFSTMHHPSDIQVVQSKFALSQSVQSIAIYPFNAC